jgi:hypothetical protein
VFHSLHNLHASDLPVGSGETISSLREDAIANGEEDSTMSEHSYWVQIPALPLSSTVTTDPFLSWHYAPRCAVRTKYYIQSS